MTFLPNESTGTIGINSDDDNSALFPALFTEANPNFLHFLFSLLTVVPEKFDNNFFTSSSQMNVRRMHVDRKMKEVHSEVQVS